MTLPPSLRRQAKRAIGAVGIAAEKRIAKRLGTRQTPNSGAMAGAKGDLVMPNVLVEAKSTLADRLSIKLDWLAKITGEARAASKVPAVAITFVTGNGHPRQNGSWVLIREQDFKEMQGG